VGHDFAGYRVRVRVSPPSTDPNVEAQEDGEQAELIQRAFGQENRRRLLARYLDSLDDLSASTAWKHVYRLLLWIDPTIGLAHCYESDKCQPGRPWYGRSLAFHVWLAKELGVSPLTLGKEIDQLFTWAIADLAAYAASKREQYAAAAEAQRAAYAPEKLPIPGEDPEFTEIVYRHLQPWFSSTPDPQVLRSLATSVRLYIGQENKRKNLVGEGFEDTLAAILERMPKIAAAYEIRVRPYLHDLPGFREPLDDATPPQVDLALVRRADGHRILVTCKWSFRSDREKQFPNEHAAYLELRTTSKPFDYVLLTNEFDPARLASVCERVREIYPLFQAVVHVNPAGPLAAYAYAQDRLPSSVTRGISRAKSYIDSGRIIGLDEWLTDLENNAQPSRTVTVRPRRGRG